MIQYAVYNLTITKLPILPLEHSSHTHTPFLIHLQLRHAMFTESYSHDIFHA